MRALALSALLLTCLLAAPARASEPTEVYLLERGIELPAELAELAVVRELPDFRLALLPSSHPLPALDGVEPVEAAEGERLFLVDLGHGAELEDLAFEARVIDSFERHALLAVAPDRIRRLDRMGVCKERLQWVPRAPRPEALPDRRLGKVDPQTKQNIVDAVTQSRFSQIVRELSGDIVFWLDDTLQSTDNRYTHTSGSGNDIDVAADYLEDRLTAAGYPVIRQTFDVEGTSTDNIIAVKTGTVDPNSVVVVGAHYDSISEIPFSQAPGAEDNGSGTASVLQLAEVFADYQTECTVHFVLFSGEEQGLYGSQYYVSQLGANGWNVTESLIMDMISAWESNYKVIIEGETPWESLMSLFETNVTQYAQIASRKDYVSWGSDHVPFQDAGIPCFLAIDWDYGTYDDYHRSTDVYESTDPSLGMRITKAMAGTLADLSQPTIGTTAPPEVVAEVRLGQNHPNPFNPRTEIRFSTPEKGPVRLEIFDLAGRRVRTLIDGEREAGWQSVAWDGTDAQGRPVSSGMYLYRIVHPRGSDSRRMVLAK